jgi:hypothetical protein
MIVNMKEKHFINELAEILATALAGRPDLISRLSKLLGARAKPGSPGKVKKSSTKEERRESIRQQFRNMNK